MSDSKKFGNNLEDSKKLLMHFDNRMTLADELYAMSKCEDPYECLKDVATPLMKEIWGLSARYLDGEFGFFHDKDV